jgi:bifunctional ADP-heptose synthase (sugar kinase/adenylyltransferase)
LDTREKIVPLEELAAHLGGSDWLGIVGMFDPLTLGHAERLNNATTNGKNVLAVVEPGANSLLPAEARAVLVAALKSVKLVVVCEAAALPKLTQLAIITDADGERQRSLAFAEHVKERQGTK